MRASRSACLAAAFLMGSCGGGSSTTSSAPQSPPPPPPPAAPALSLLAGNPEGYGYANGAGSAARFGAPWGIVVDTSGNLFVVDEAYNAIRKIATDGSVSTFAGAANTELPNAGSADGAGTGASFFFPQGLAIDSSDNLYVADTENDTIRAITPAGDVSTIAGTAELQGSTDGTGAAARFKFPGAIAADAAGNLYVADTGNNTVRMIATGNVVSTLAGTAGTTGSANGTGAAASFDAPNGIAVDASGNIYVADTGNNTIRKIAAGAVVTTFAGTAGVVGHADGTGAAASFDGPNAISIDASGNLYVADSGNDTIRFITPAGVVSTLAGAAGAPGFANGVGSAAGFRMPSGLAVDASGVVYVSDTYNSTVRAVASGAVVSTLAGTPNVTGTENGVGAAAGFDNPLGLATDSSGNIYVADTENNAIRKVTPSGAVSTLAGTPGQSGSANGSGAAASFNEPFALAVDGQGNVYVSDTGNNTIRKITAGGTVTTLAGTAGTSGFTNGTGAAASFSFPLGVAVDADGNVYVADSNNAAVRKITPAGMVSTLVVLANGIQPNGVAVDGTGDVYISTSLQILKFSSNGTLSALAGRYGVSGTSDGTGTAATFGGATALSLDASGNIYVADFPNDAIRKVTPAGVVTTVAGTAGVASWVGGGLPGTIDYPSGVAVHESTLYITLNNAIVQLTNLP